MMAESVKGMTIIEVLPRNYNEIIERSSSSKKPYTKDDLDRILAEARSKNSAAFVMFMDPGFWTQGESKK
jgi:hypothetical protein